MSHITDEEAGRAVSAVRAAFTLLEAADIDWQALDREFERTAGLMPIIDPTAVLAGDLDNIMRYRPVFKAAKALQEAGREVPWWTRV